MLCRRMDILRYLIANMAAVSCQKHYCYSTSVSLHHASSVRLCCQQQHWSNERFDICPRHICRMNVFLHMTNFSAIGKCTELFALPRKSRIVRFKWNKEPKMSENNREFPADSRISGWLLMFRDRMILIWFASSPFDRMKNSIFIFSEH